MRECMRGTNAPSMCGDIHCIDELNREVPVPDESANKLIVKNDYEVVKRDYYWLEHQFQIAGSFGPLHQSG